MDVTETLDELRADCTGCDLIAFADLSSGMVLCTSAALKPPQEELDALTASAASTISAGLSDDLAPIVGPAPAVAVAATALEARVVLRGADAPNEALICLCSPGTDLDRVIGKGLQALSAIQEG